jgi:hypothetical protein
MEFKFFYNRETCYEYKERDDNGISENELFPFKNTESIKVYDKK